jgi:hypothetical protein
LLLQRMCSRLVWVHGSNKRLDRDMHVVCPRYLLDGCGQHKLLGHHLRRWHVWPCWVFERYCCNMHIMRLWNLCP